MIGIYAVNVTGIPALPQTGPDGDNVAIGFVAEIIEISVEFPPFVRCEVEREFESQFVIGCQVERCIHNDRNAINQIAAFFSNDLK